MTVSLDIRVVGADRLAKGLSSAPATIASETRAAMTKSLLLLEATQRRTVAQDTRRLMGSINHKIYGSGANITGHVGPAARYGYWVEYGRKRGNPPPVAAVAGWAKRHGVNPYVLARAIGRKGTKKQPFVAPSLKTNRAKINSIFAAIGVKVVARIT